MHAHLRRLEQSRPGADDPGDIRGRHAAGLDVAGKADAAQPAAAPGFFAALGEPGVVGRFRRTVQDPLVVAAVVLHDHGSLVRQGIGRNEVAATKFDRVDPEFPRGGFHHPLQQESGLPAGRRPVPRPPAPCW